jgi:hypothetical protein
MPDNPAETPSDEPIGTPDVVNEPVQISDSLEKVYTELSQEANQDQALTDPNKSFLEELNAELFSEREREYRDVEKQWVRTKGWLNAAKEIAGNNGRGIRLFTLPAYYRIDVSLFLRERLLEVIEQFDDGKAKTVYVAAFESDPTKYARMVGHTPKFLLFGDCPIEDALINVNNPYYDDLLKLFPFDIVNLDLTTCLTPKNEGPYSKTMQAIEAVFKRQAEHGSMWALFLTYRNMPDEWEDVTLEQLFENLQRNLDGYPKVLAAFMDLYHESAVRKLYAARPPICISQAVVKWLVDRANYYNLVLNSVRSFYYERPPIGYLIYKHILVFSKGTALPGVVPTKGTPAQPWMPDALEKCIRQHKPIDVVEKILITLNGRPTFQDELQSEINELCKAIEYS